MPIPTPSKLCQLKTGTNYFESSLNVEMQLTIGLGLGNRAKVLLKN